MNLEYKYRIIQAAFIKYIMQRDGLQLLQACTAMSTLCSVVEASMLEEKAKEA